ncbi:MAG: hypothetical protein LPH21_06020 [Shewanella sp.]|nr:hypothetical protein [Shewanella sp.]
MNKKDYSKWVQAGERFNHDLYSFMLSGQLLEDGIHTIKVNGDIEIDFITKGMKSTHHHNNNFICFFNGAVSNRSEKTPPFFSGLGIFESLNIPTISFSDPTIDLSNGISIGWYAGSKHFNKLQELIAVIIKTYMMTTNSRPVLVGGSGGGFAALSMTELLDTDTFTIVWNPQTNILKYERESVSKYANIAFNCSADELEQELSRNNIKYDLVKKIQSKNGKILFIQNRTDWHFQEHAIPFLNKNNVELTENNPKKWQENIYYYLSNFGFGHIGPSKNLIQKLIKSIVKNHIPESFEFEEHGNESSSAILYNTDFNYNSEINNEVIRLSISPNNLSYNYINTKYCFYIYSNGERIVNTGYQNENLFTFDIKKLGVNKCFNFEFVFFAMDSGFRVNSKKAIKYRESL